MQKYRLGVYLDIKNKETQKFISLYGEKDLQNIFNWEDILFNSFNRCVLIGVIFDKHKLSIPTILQASAESFFTA